ncbi:hypothetical protein ACQKKF_25200, partial [Pedobacter suwonensis]|uniref:hypothetical protein n=1 Tax=Pedobacter suwonensis TaxID=332999 RepID=UPI003CFD9B76
NPYCWHSVDKLLLRFDDIKFIPITGIKRKTMPKNTTRTLRGEKPFKRYRREHRKNVDISMF